MKRILIFKTDKLGDLINISSIIYNIKKQFPFCQIDLVVSNYNKSIAEYYSKYVNIFIYNKSLIFFLLTYFKFFFLSSYDHVFQFDGKKKSYIASLFIRSKKKSCIQFIKIKKIFFKTFIIKRPSNFIRFFFTNSLLCLENYDHINNKKYHYLSLYIKLVRLSGIKIFDKSHFFPNFKKKIISKYKKNYILIHIDDKWLNFKNDLMVNFFYKIKKLSINNKIVITSGLNTEFFFDNFLHLMNFNSNVQIIKNPKLYKLINLIYFSRACLSSHSGLIVHLAAAFKIKIYDLVHKNIFNELDRWAPYNINYKRIDINLLLKKSNNFLLRI